MGRGAALIVVAMSLLLGLATPALAQAQATADATSHEAGETAYEGTQEAGGPVTLVVQTEPAQIVAFEVEGVAGGGCSWDTITLENWGGAFAIVDQRFEATNPDGDVLQGAWLGDGPADRRFEGTIQVSDPAKGCQTPPLRWVAARSPAP
jgi:hypothetical protein